MGEIKSVKVDNWGAFFLQKLQNFFNKTDYCDLTLQFNDNSQLKVHKLVLSACTDYFNVLEQTCEMIDDILIMPNELQADLVVPIVNFMYTGTLEFELKMYGKLLKTAKDMNMTVLLKLLEAHRRTMESGTKQVIRNTRTSPRQTYLNANIKPATPIPSIIETSSGNNSSQVKRRLLSAKVEPYRKLQIKPIHSTTYTDANTILTTKYQNTKITPVKGPSRFEYEGENILQDTFESSFDTISYESKPLKEDINENDNQQQHAKEESTTSLQFEQLRRTGYNNNKRPAQSILQSPPTKKPNIQDVKEYAEQQRMRKQIAEEYGEEFEDNLDDEFHNADDDEEYISAPIQQQTKITKTLLKSANNLKQKAHEQNQNLRKSTTNVGINVKQEEKPRIVVKDSTSSNVDHAKIISEVLRKYPHLIKNNKNIKLKIMPNASGNGGPQRVVIKKEPDTIISPVPSTSKSALSDIQDTKLLKVPSTQQKVSTAQVQKPIATVAPASQPRRIDSKIMKALISLGAENTTGPWLCLRCGVNGRPISIPSYRGFRRHLINTHKEKIDPRLCEHCGWRSTTNKELLFHMQMEHQIKCNINFPKCEHCGLVVFDLSALDDHIDEYHPESKEQQCIYCNKSFSVEILLYNHMKAEHKERAKDDGVIDFSDEEHIEEFDNTDDYEQESNEKKSPSSKIQILSDINLPKCISLTKTAPDTTILSNIDYIATSSTLETTDKGPKFVNAEGNVMELTPAQRDEIISQLEQSGGDGVVMVLNDEPFGKDQETTDIESSDEKIQTISSQQLGDNNMLIVYDQQEISEKNNEKIIEENKDKKLGKEIKSKDVDEEMKWKNDISQGNIEEEPSKILESEIDLKQQSSEKRETTNKSNIKKDEKDSSDLDMKLKLLTGDWTEDEDEECIEKESKTNKSEDDKILDILGKNNDSADVDENKKIEIIEETKDADLKNEEIKEKNDEDNHTVTEETTKEIDDENVNKGIETESYENNAIYEEVLLSTVTGNSSAEEIKVKEKNENPDKPKDDNKTTESNIQDNKDDNEIIDTKDNIEDTDNKQETTKQEILTLSEEPPVVEGNDGNSEKELESEVIPDNTRKIEQLEDDEYLNKSDENKKSEEMKSTIKIKDDFDELSQTKTKDEIKNLISEWGDDDDEL